MGTEVLFTPFALGRTELRNRVFVPGHTTNFGYNNTPTERHAAYHAERAKGGVGLIITEAVRVHPTSAGRHISLGSFSDASIPAYARIAEAVHEHGTKLFAQIMHAGRQANGDATRTAAWSASPVRWTSGAHVPHAMGRDDIATVVKAFGDAARRMREAGYDGLEVHAGHGHLLQQFLSPHTNLRDDAYGGSLDNRMRLTREVLAAVFAENGEIPVGLRVSADEFLPGGLDPKAVVEIVALLHTEFPLAFVHVSHSAYQGTYSLATQMADMSFGHAPFRHHAALFKREFPDLPVLAVCRLDSLPEAAELIADGDADLVGLARPHIADPHLVRKALDGRQHEVRSCLACNQGCIGRLESSLPISCVVNPEVGAEKAWGEFYESKPAEARKVVVIGGGPAGMSAALAAHGEGHEVTLVESACRLGGRIDVAARVPGRERLGLLVADLARDVTAAGIEVRMNERATPASILAGGYDHVIVATGGRPAAREFTGGPPVFDVVTAISDLALFHGTVVVLDDEGTWAAASVAEQLARQGVRVHLVSPSASVSARITTYSRLALLDRFATLGVRVHPMRLVRPAGPPSEGTTAVRLVDPLSGDEQPLDGVTAIVDAGTPVADDELYRALEGRQDGLRVQVVGDANSPRSALEAVYEGRLAGAFLGRDDAVTERIRSAH